MEFPNIKDIAPSESGYPVKDYSLNFENDEEEDRADYDDDNRSLTNFYTD